ncbi:MAG: YbaY family lipoprotein [Steroidobacteraceae bacterium]
MNTSTKYLLLASILLLSACAKKPEQNQPGITGMLSYSTPVTFTDSTRLELQLTDVSVNDGPALQVASTTVQNLSELPYQYALPYPQQAINPKHRYTIEARIYSGQTLRFATDTAYEVLTMGKPQQQNLQVVAAGSNENAVLNTPAPVGETVFQGELRTANEVTLYRTGLLERHIVWLAEERSNDTPQPIQARYEYKGALLQHYRDSTGLEVQFDLRGRPEHMQRQQQVLEIQQQTDTLASIRNRAELLRSHALATREAQAHRQATEQWQGNSGLTQFGGNHLKP